jgi:hypothetical protein
LEGITYHHTMTLIGRKLGEDALHFQMVC